MTAVPPPQDSGPGQAAPSADELLKRAADALWACAKASLTVKPVLSTPYPELPQWTPYTRWVERPAREAHDTAMAIRKRLREAPRDQAAPEPVNQEEQ